MNNKRLLLLLSTLSLLGACNNEPTFEEALSEYCEVNAERATMCGQTLPANALQQCEDNFGPIFALVRSDARDPVIACVGGLACADSDDGCYVAAGLGLTPSDAATAFQSACTTRSEECEFSDDICFANILVDDVIADLDACLASECGEVRTCMGEVLPD